VPGQLDLRNAVIRPARPDAPAVPVAAARRCV